MYNLANAKEMVEAAVTKMGPDFIYNPSVGGSCIYLPWDDNRNGALGNDSDPRYKTGCIVGTALAAVLTPEQMSQLNGDILEFWSNSKWFQNLFDDESVGYLRVVQRHQDGGKSWGKAAQMGAESYPGGVAATSVA